LKCFDDGKETHQNGFRHFLFNKKYGVKKVDSEKQNAKQSCPEFFDETSLLMDFLFRTLQVQIPIKNIIIPIGNAPKD